MSAMLREPALLKQLKEQAETHARELRAYEATVANLEHQLDTERMRLVACGVIALANTPESAAQAREMLPEYWSASAKDCADMVDREMALRERIRQMEGERVPEGWIPVSERLPELGTDVLVYCCRRNGAIEKTTMVAGLFDPYRDPKRPVWMDTVSEASIPDRWKVTHWIPLPEAPQPKKEGE